MTRAKKRLVVVAVLALLVAAGAFVAFQMSTRGSLHRAEAFLFRRMQVTRLEDGSFLFFYITNRSPGENDGSLERRFSNQREEGLRFGSYDAAIEPSLGLSEFFDPSKWFRNEEVEIRDERELGRSQFVHDLRATVERTPLRSLLVIVHGYREQFPSALRKTAFVSHILDLNTPVLLFDWPGDQPGGPVSAYRRAVEVAEASGAELARALEMVIRDVQPQWGDRLSPTPCICSTRKPISPTRRPSSRTSY
jgi:esterase/lipase superfamily enzyme